MSKSKSNIFNLLFKGPANNAPAQSPAINAPAQSPAINAPANNAPANNAPANNAPAINAPAQGPAINAPAQDKSIDTKMRESYSVWNDYCRKYNLNTTPAYDVVGLLACLVNDKKSLFDIEDDKDLKLNNKQIQTKKIILKEEYRNPESLTLINGAIQDAKSYAEKKNLLIITDFGEECDDEVTCILANKLLPEIDVKIVFTNHNFNEQLWKYISFGGNPAIVTSIYDDTFEKLMQSLDNTIILQIGPIHANNKIKKILETTLIDKTYDWYLVGAFGETLNSKRDSKGNALLFHNNSTNSFIVDTMRGKGAFPFSYNALNDLELNDELIEHVIKIGWRNTVGRASYKGGRHVAHLVAEDDGSANYKTVRNIDTHLMRIKDKNTITETDKDNANDLATNYFELLKTAPTKEEDKLTEDKDGITNSTSKLNKTLIINGYVYILTTLYRWFGVPINFFESGSEENWDKQWDNPGYKFKENKLKQSGGKTKKNKKTKKLKKTKKTKKPKKNKKTTTAKKIRNMLNKL